MVRFHIWAARAAACAKGWRTLATFAAVFVLAVLEQLGTIDLKAVLMLLGVPEPSVPGVVAAIGLLGIVLRLYTTTPPLQAVPPADGPK